MSFLIGCAGENAGDAMIYWYTHDVFGFSVGAVGL